MGGCGKPVKKILISRDPRHRPKKDMADSGVLDDKISNSNSIYFIFEAA
jgi:hypothetical protein